MIRFKQNMQVAAVVLAAVNATLNDDDDMSRFHVEAYSNGREQGYCIKGWLDAGKSVGVAFSEYRNSDAIVVYSGANNDFSMQGNVPEEETWRNARHFKPGAYQEAADFIVQTLRDALIYDKSPVAAV